MGSWERLSLLKSLGIDEGSVCGSGAIQCLPGCGLTLVCVLGDDPRGHHSGAAYFVSRGRLFAV